MLDKMSPLKFIPEQIVRMLPYLIGSLNHDSREKQNLMMTCRGWFSFNTVNNHIAESGEYCVSCEIVLGTAFPGNNSQ